MTRHAGEPAVRATAIAFENRSGFGVLTNVNLEVPAGSAMAVTGPPSSGKSLLLHILYGLLQPRAGSVEIMGEDVYSKTYRQLVAMWGKMGYAFQDGALVSNLSAYENVALPLIYHSGKRGRPVDSAVREMLKKLDIEQYAEMRPASLSPNIKKRVGLARALVRNPSVVFIDDPETGADETMLARTAQILREGTMDMGQTFVVSVHNVEYARSFADRIAFLNNGAVSYIED